MSETTDDIIDGSCCSLCGQYFKSGVPEEVYAHGYPVLCKKCWNRQLPQERNKKINMLGQQKALKNVF